MLNTLSLHNLLSIKRTGQNQQLANLTAYNASHNTGHTDHLPVCVVRAVVPIDIHSGPLNKTSSRHRQHRHDHSNKHTHSQRRADSTSVKQRVNNAVEERQQQQNTCNVEQWQPCCRNLYTRRHRQSGCTQSISFTHNALYM